MSCKTTLPAVFPHRFFGPPNEVRGLATTLLSSDRTDVANGSSFAVTVDNGSGSWNLWLSRASYDFLVVELGSFPGGTA